MGIFFIEDSSRFLINEDRGFSGQIKLKRTRGPTLTEREGRGGRKEAKKPEMLF